MSKVTITLELDRYICAELEEVRDMIKRLDFSDLPAAVERIQKHANAMEKGLYNYKYYLEDIKAIIKDEKDSMSINVDTSPVTVETKPLTDAEKLIAIEAVLKKKYHDNW